jgi:tetratricopeptide (TPR) repeat protein
MGKPGEAKPWHDAALAAYLESAARGEVHYYHHLAGFYADVHQDGAEAVKWARKDAELRPNFMTQDGLAWALYRNGQFPAALDAMEKTLSSGVKDSHLFFHAAMIHLAAGRTGEGKRLLKTVAEINPGYENFHVHR